MLIFSGWLGRPHEIGRRHQRDLWTHQGGVQLHTKPVPQVKCCISHIWLVEHLVILNYYSLQSQVGMRKVGPRKNGNAKALRYGNTPFFFHSAVKYHVNYSNFCFQYYEMSYGLNVEMHKQTEICKRLDAIIRQVLPFLSAEVCTLYFSIIYTGVFYITFLSPTAPTASGPRSRQSQANYHYGT